MDLTALYEQLPPEKQQLLDEINFLAGNLNEHLILEQFYLALAAMSERIQKLHPAIPCPSGCSRCCESYALPEVLPAEWELIAAGLQQLQPALQQRIAAAVRASTEVLENGRLRGRRQDYPGFRCPLLIDGHCAVYAVRPFDCRITGYGFSTAGERPLPSPMHRPPGQPLPYSCGSEQLRMLTELESGESPLEYMFLPQREHLWQALQQIEPSGRGPELLLQHLLDWANALTTPAS